MSAFVTLFVTILLTVFVTLSLFGAYFVFVTWFEFFKHHRHMVNVFVTQKIN
jgi:hypothetical protein